MSARSPYQLRPIRQFIEIPKGSQIAVRCSFRNLDETLALLYPFFFTEEFYYHHGVFMGGYDVVHFSGQNKEDAKPRSCDLYEFLSNSEDKVIYIVKYDDSDKLRPVGETLRYARETLENPNKWPKYHLAGNNCESFATWLKTDKFESVQVKFALHRVIDLAGKALVGSSASAS